MSNDTKSSYSVLYIVLYLNIGCNPKYTETQEGQVGVPVISVR